MNYHVHLGDGNITSLPLEELRRRRDDGRMSGQEFVWREGMPNWQTLDFVLGRRPLISPPPKRDNRLLAVCLIVGSIVFIASMIWYGYYMRRAFMQGFRQARASQAQNAAPDMNSTTGVEQAERPIQTGKGTMTERDIRKRQRAFRLRNYRDAYAELGPHQHIWDRDARLLLQSAIDSRYGDDKGRTGAEPVQLANKLAGNPSCNDPIVLTIAGTCSPELFEASHRYERAVAAFADSHYKAYPQFFATVMLSADEIRLHQTARIDALDQSALNLLKESLHDGSVRPDDEMDIGETLVSGWGKGLFERRRQEVCAIADDAGSSYGWLAGLLHGVTEIDLAWKARGDGYANTVTADGWKNFADHIAKAADALSQAWKLHPEWPQVPALMIRVAMAQSDVEAMRLWFDRMTVAQIDYYAGWHNFRWGLRPRWLGSLSAIRALGVAAIDTGRFDTDVPRYFFDCVADIEQDTDCPNGQHIYGQPDIWPQMQRMYEGYINEETTSGHDEGWRGAYATVAYLAHDYAAAAEQLEKIDWQVPARTLGGWGTDLSLLAMEVAARTGPHSVQINKAESLIDSNKFKDALDLYRKISAGDDSRTLEFVDHRIAWLEFEKKLESGEWVDFLPNQAGDLNWIATRGDITVQPDGAVDVASGPEGSMILCRARIGGEFEIKGEFEVVSSSTGDFQAGLVMGLPDPNKWSWLALRIKRNSNEGDVVQYTHGWSPKGVSQRLALDGHKNSFDFKLHAQKATATVNGQAVIINAAYPGWTGIADDQFQLGLGAYNDMNNTVIRYTNVKVRRL